MEAKDTVMGDKQMLASIRQHRGLAAWDTYKPTLCLDERAIQAEISFKAGIEEGWAQAEARYHIDTG